MNSTYSALMASGFGELLVAALSLCGFVWLAAAILLAVAVKKDVERRLEREAAVFLFGGDAWCFVVLASGGFLGTIAYWLFHYSSLRYVPHGTGRMSENKFRSPFEKSRSE